MSDPRGLLGPSGDPTPKGIAFDVRSAASFGRRKFTGLNRGSNGVCSQAANRRSIAE
jgi:hypothetical protein